MGNDVYQLVDIVTHWKTILRSGCIGTAIGVIPGVGEDIAAWSSYAAAKRASNEPEKFGKGSIDGLMAISPSIEPLPNFSGSLLARFAAAYELQAAISSPTPGITPIAVPIHPDRKMVFQWVTMSTSW